MRYPILIEQGIDIAAFGVVVPDLRGCFSAGDSPRLAVASHERKLVSTALAMRKEG